MEQKDSDCCLSIVPLKIEKQHKTQERLNMTHLKIFFLSLFFLGNISFACDGPVRVSDAWCKVSLKGSKNGAVFMTLESLSKVSLVKAESDVAKKVELHTHIQDGEIMIMRPVDSFPLEPNETRELKPGHDHIMLIGLHEPLKSGQEIDVKLTFDDGSTQTVSVPVRIQPAKSPCGCKH